MWENFEQVQKIPWKTKLRGENALQTWHHIKNYHMKFLYFPIIIVVLALAGATALADTVEAGNIAALSSETLSEAIRYSVQKDEVAFAKLLLSGQIIILKKSESVEVTGSKGLGLLKVRPRGSTVHFWVVREAVKRN
jgi:hypothetical protein